MKKQVLFIFSIWGLVGCASAFGPAFNQWAAQELCADFDCRCLAQIQAGAVAPDEVFRDETNHHCWIPAQECAPGEWVCPTTTDCPLKEKMDAYIASAKKKTGCKRWYDIGVALNYFLSSKSQLRQVQYQGTTGRKDCLIPFEEMVDEQISANLTQWSACKCGICLTDSMTSWMIEEFANQLQFTVSWGPGEAEEVILLSNSIDFPPASDLIEELLTAEVAVSPVAPSEFESAKEKTFILILGGHHAPEGVGEFVDQALSAWDKNLLLARNDSSYLFAKLNVWRPGQIVLIAAGYEAEDTIRAWWDNQEVIKEAIKMADVGRECVSAIDCGVPLNGPYTCSGNELLQMVYTPHCKSFACKMQADPKFIKRCDQRHKCVPGFDNCILLTDIQKDPEKYGFSP